MLLLRAFKIDILWRAVSERIEHSALKHPHLSIMSFWRSRIWSAVEVVIPLPLSAVRQIMMLTPRTLEDPEK